LDGRRFSVVARELISIGIEDDSRKVQGSRSFFEKKGRALNSTRAPMGKSFCFFFQKEALPCALSFSLNAGLY